MLGGLKQVGAIKIFTGNANKPLAEHISRILGEPLGKCFVGRFADGETDVRILENVRGCDCYVIQPTCRPVNESAMELLIMLDALRRASAGRITAVIPYYGYARADRKTLPRVPITAKLLANLITSAGANRVITLDLHANQIQGFFDIPLDHLHANPVFLDYLKSKELSNKVVVAPDVGGVERARAIAKRLNTGLVIIDKRRPMTNHAMVYNVVGNVKNCSAIIFDDMIDTGGTLCSVARAVKDQGAKRVFAVCTHGVLSNGALACIEESPIEEVIITNTIPFPGKPGGRVKILSVAKILAEAIGRNHRGQSISEMFG